MLKQHFDFVPEYLKERPAPAQQLASADATQLPAAAAEQLSAGAASNAVTETTQPPSATTVAPVKTAVSITSEPAGAEITIDGQFDSSTPSKVLLAPGEHTIKVTRPGFKPWERKITVEIGAEKTIKALLEKEPPANKTTPKQ